MNTNILRYDSSKYEYFDNIINFLDYFYNLYDSDKKMLSFLLNSVKYNTYNTTFKVRFTIKGLMEDDSFPLRDRRTIRGSLRRLEKLPFFRIGRGTKSGYNVTINKELIRGNIKLHFRFPNYEDRYSRGNAKRLIKYKNITIPKSTTPNEDVLAITLDCGNVLYDYVG